MKTTLILLSLILSVAANAKGSAIESGVNIGGGNNGSEYMASWCKGQSSILRNYRDRAALKLENSGDYNYANKILNDGMLQALKTLKEDNNSFLAKSIARGLEISRNLEATSAKNNDRKAMVINTVLKSYYGFMLDTVATDLDIGAYIPYMQAHRDQMDQRAAHFEERFVVYASSQLQWILNNLTSRTVLGDKVITVPVGDAKTLIKVSMVLLKATSEDLEESLWVNQFSCAISDLKILDETITSYDQGNKEMFDNEVVAVGYLSQEIARIASSLRLKASCN